MLYKFNFSKTKIIIGCDANTVFSLATSAGKMGLSYLLSISPISSARKCSLYGHIMNPLLTKVVHSRRLDFCLILSCLSLPLTSSQSIQVQERTWPKSMNLQRTSLVQDEIYLKKVFTGLQDLQYKSINNV